jgi:dTDP-glucose 4,6-dehydratase
MARVVVAGGAGMIGSHLCDELIRRGDSVICVDNFSTGAQMNIAQLREHPRFELLVHDVTQPLVLDGAVDAVLHFASPASPKDYLRMPVETLDVGSAGTRNLLELAVATGARFLLASTSEVYGDPVVHPQTEDYWGHVNPIGPRSVYDEAKRFAEALTMAYHRAKQVDTKIVRIFNTYGERMRPDDGRVVSNFVVQALTGAPITVYGDGTQTRSFCYVRDQVRGILALLDSREHSPVNIGNPTEFTVRELAELVIEVVGSSSTIVHETLPVDDPRQRRPDISRARALLGWEPEVCLREGVERTARWFDCQIHA